ncbi:MAG: ATP-grasp domain-containing protein [Bacteroidales bacterium]|jgi:carbamoyl-phosphate synthase large subunit|nr:ATP-grasp domain-containing protein [Bacteroidales bacterium]
MKKLKSIKVFITGAGAPGAPGIIKSLRKVTERKIAVIGGDANPGNSVGAGLLDKVFQIPIAESPDFIEKVLDICVAEKVDVIIPLVTRELLVFARNKEKFFKSGIYISVSDPRPLETANNKYLLMKFCRENNIPVPDFNLVHSLDEFRTAARELGYPGKKICFKPPVSNGLRGFRIIEDGQDRLFSLMNEKPNNVYISFDEFVSICVGGKEFPELIVMEYLPGDEYSVDVLVDNGKFISAIPRSRDHIKMGISFVGTVIEEREIIGYSRMIVEGLKLNGNIGLQFKRDGNGIPKVIESNPRVQGTIVLCTAAGENMVYEAVKIGVGEKPVPPEINWGLKMIRYWDELFLDINGNKVDF